MGQSMSHAARRVSAEALNDGMLHAGCAAAGRMAAAAWRAFSSEQAAVRALAGGRPTAVRTAASAVPVNAGAAKAGHSPPAGAPTLGLWLPGQVAETAPCPRLTEVCSRSWSPHLAFSCALSACIALTHSCATSAPESSMTSGFMGFEASASAANATNTCHHQGAVHCTHSSQRH